MKWYKESMMRRAEDYEAGFAFDDVRRPFKKQYEKLKAEKTLDEYMLRKIINEMSADLETMLTERGHGNKSAQISDWLLKLQGQNFNAMSNGIEVFFDSTFFGVEKLIQPKKANPADVEKAVGQLKRKINGIVNGNSGNGAWQEAELSPEAFEQAYKDPVIIEYAANSVQLILEDVLRFHSEGSPNLAKRSVDKIIRIINSFPLAAQDPRVKEVLSKIPNAISKIPNTTNFN